MGRRSDVSVPELEVAGNGLLDRRIFLKQGVALLSARRSRARSSAR